MLKKALIMACLVALLTALAILYYLYTEQQNEAKRSRSSERNIQAELLVEFSELTELNDAIIDEKESDTKYIIRKDYELYYVFFDRKAERISRIVRGYEIIYEQGEEIYGEEELAGGE